MTAFGPGTLAAVAAVKAACSWSVETHAPGNLFSAMKSLIVTVPGCQ